MAQIEDNENNKNNENSENNEIAREQSNTVQCSYCDHETKVEMVCISCKKYYCLDHQSHKLLGRCVKCTEDITVEDKKIQKISTRYSVEKDKIIKKLRSCRQISFSGEMWRVQEKLIHTLTDDELHDMIEVTRASVNLMEHEILERNIEAARKKVLKDREYKLIKTVKAVDGKVKISVTNRPEVKSDMSAIAKKAGVSQDTIKRMLEKLMKGSNVVS